MTTTADYNFDVKRTANLPLAEQLHLKRKKDLIEMLVVNDKREQDRRNFMEKCSTTYVVEIEDIAYYDCDELVAFMKDNGAKSVRQFSENWQGAVTTTTLFRAECETNTDASKLSQLVDEWADENEFYINSNMIA